MNVDVDLVFLLSNFIENYGEQVDILRSTFQERFNHVRQIATRFLKTSNKIVWKCDQSTNNGMLNASETISVIP